MRAAIYLFVFLVLLGPARAVSAQEENAHAAARALAQEGAALFERSDFQAALDKFQQAYGKFPTPKLFLNIGQALRGLSRNVEALAAFERFLAEAKDARPEFIELASAQVAQLEAKVARLAVESNRKGAEVTVDGEKRGTVPLSAPMIVEPGVHKVTVAWEGESKAVDVTATAGQEVSQAIDFEDKPPPPAPVVVAPKPEPLPPVPAPPPVPEAPPAARSHIWYWIAGGAVVAAVATTLVILYARSDEYPNADLGRRTIGDMR
jgi:tetratricopeptide (TPR) repeat protein